METRKLGSTGPQTSRLGLGLMGMSDLYGPADRAESLATIHASSSQQAFTRLATYAIQAPERLSFEASALLIGGAVDFVVHLAWSTDGRRVVSSIREVTGADGRTVVSNEVYVPGPDLRATPATPVRAQTLDRLAAAGLNPDILGQGW